MGDDPEIFDGTDRYVLPPQQPRSEPPTHRAPPVAGGDGTIAAINAGHLEAHQVLAAAAYVRRIARNYRSDPAYRACWTRAVEIYRDLEDRTDPESVRLRRRIRELFGREHREGG